MSHLSPISSFSSLAAGWRWVSAIAAKLRVIGVMLLVALMLGGCVDADVGIRFKSPQQGEIVQHIRLGERLRSLQGERVQQWLKAVERQTQSVGGQVQRSTNSRSPNPELIVKIPFNNSNELEQKFNQFFGSTFGQVEAVAGRLPIVESRLTIAHSNFLLLERSRLRYDVDLRSLGVASSNGDVLVSPTSLFDLEFKLETPWGARNVTQLEGLRPRSRNGGRELIWSLVPGEQNAVEVVFWLPSPIGIGAVLIILLVVLGQFLRYPGSADLLRARSPS